MWINPTAATATCKTVAHWYVVQWFDVDWWINYKIASDEPDEKGNYLF